MRYFHYGSWQTDAVRQTYPTQFTGGGGNKLGALEKKVDVPIDSVETTIKQGTWGSIPSGVNPLETGKAAGLVCFTTRGTGLNTKTLWYQIGVDSDGRVFAELGWRVGPLKGSRIEFFDKKKITITDYTPLKMVPKGDTVDFYVGTNKKTLTWTQNPQDWNAGSRAPNFDWTDMNKIVGIRVQIEAYWISRSASSNASQMELPGTRSDPFVFGPTIYTYRTKSEVVSETIRGSDFSQSDDNDDNFRRQSIRGNKVKMWSSQNK